MIIQHNISALNSHRQLGLNNVGTSKNLEKLSSGYKINRAGDDAAGLAISEKMRGQIRGLAMAEQNANNGISLIQTAEGGLNETHAILQRMRELAVQSSNGTYKDEVDRENLDKEVQALKSEIDRISTSTHYNGIKLLDGSLDETGSVTAGKAGKAAKLDLSELAKASGALTTTAATESEFVSDAVTAVGTDTTNSWTINYLDAAGKAQSVTVSLTDESDSISDLDAALAAELDKTGLKNLFDITVDTGAITFTSKTAGSVGPQVVSISEVVDGAAASDVAVAATLGTDAYESLTKDVGLFDGTGNADDFIFTVDGKKFAYAKDADSAAKLGNNVNYIIATSIDTAATTNMVDLINGKTNANASVNAIADTTIDFMPAAGGSPISGSGLIFQIGANGGADQRVSLSVGNMSASGIGVEGVDVLSRDSANASIDVIDAAINQVSGTRADLGALQNRLEHTLNNLGVSKENLTAAESSIRDVDMAKEMMEFTKNNILVQASQAMLAQANQLPQGVLSLLR